MLDAFAEVTGQKIDRKTIAKTTAEYKNFLILGSPC
jgi:predicted ATPase with chaperone activity